MGWPLALGLFIALYIAGILWYRFRPLPPGIDVVPASFPVRSENIQFVQDSTWHEHGHRHSHLETLETVLDIIHEARSFIVMDIFLFNRYREEDSHVDSTRRVVWALERTACPRIFITDPANSMYGTTKCPPLDWLRVAGVVVCETDVDALPDNNLFYAPLWRLILRWFGVGKSGRIQNPFGRPTTIRALLKAANGRGNHRKVICADPGGEWTTFVTSSNLENSGALFCNAGLLVRDQNLAREMVRTELAVARMSGCSVEALLPDRLPETSADATVTPLTGKHIRKWILKDISLAGAGDRITVCMLFLSDRASLEALREAAERGVEVTLILDPNTNSFWKEKSGIPNLVVANEIRGKEPRIAIRLYRGKNEEFHDKMVVIEREGSIIIHAGSANLTRRGLLGTNLEANLRVEAPAKSAVAVEVRKHLDLLGQEYYSREFTVVRLPLWASLLYRLQEHTGCSLF